MKTETYNGYTNYETWNVCLWCDNDEPIYRAYQRAKDREPFTAETARAFVEDIYPDGTPDFDDMGGAKAYAGVNWDEVAESFNQD